MSNGWSLWVIGLATLNLGITLFLFMWAPWARIPTLADGTSGHIWAHGKIREGVRKLPLWWVLLSAAAFVAAIVYLVLYPGYGNSKGTLGWTSQGELARDERVNNQRLENLLERFDLYSVDALSRDAAAVQMGARLFGDNCAACHGPQGSGNMALGAPDLGDDDWLYGGKDSDITASIGNGRNGVMPAWNSLGEQTDRNLAEYVLALSGREHDAAMARSVEPVFKSTCAACHGDDGRGNQAIGAPNLTDGTWLHGGSREDILTSIREGRQGQMPAWNKRLNSDQIKVLSAYVRQLASGHDDPPR